jgi:pimeloyl-ACP methyl ester carboxylesterase
MPGGDAVIIDAARRPPGLRALVISGEFAANPARNTFLRVRIKAARFLPGPLYRAVTLRLHASSLSSPYDADGEVPGSARSTHELFIRNTPYRSYVARADAALDADYRDRPPEIEAPTLITTPSHDTLIGEDSAAETLMGIPDSREVVPERTGYILRFSHPVTYAAAIRDFLLDISGGDPTRLCA